MTGLLGYHHHLHYNETTLLPLAPCVRFPFYCSQTTDICSLEYVQYWDLVLCLLVSERVILDRFTESRLFADLGVNASINIFRAYPSLSPLSTANQLLQVQQLQDLTTYLIHSSVSSTDSAKQKRIQILQYTDAILAYSR